MATEPLDVRIVPRDLGKGEVGKLLLISAISLAPVVLAILMQKSALRQSIVMHASHYGGEICSAQAEFWASKAAQCKTVYNVARM
jgi:hypothetical protein